MSRVKEALAPNDYTVSNERYLQVDAGRVRFDIMRLLETYPELADDYELRFDVLEGETSIDEMLTRLFLAWRQREELAEGAKTIKADLDARIKRNADAAKKLRGIAQTLMETAGFETRTLPAVSLSIQSGRKGVQVTDVEALPQGAYTMVRKPIPAKDLEALVLASAPGEFPGAVLVFGEDFLTARAK